jgi:hypothetical protein
MQITVEYMILIPILILQIFLFPIVVSNTMNTWVDSRQTLLLKESASHLSSSIQQIYFSLNHTTILDGTLTTKLSAQPLIEGHPYTANASFRTISDPTFDSKILDITLHLDGTKIATTTSLTLGPNAVWQDTVFTSNSALACIKAQKIDSTILLSFES